MAPAQNLREMSVHVLRGTAGAGAASAGTAGAESGEGAARAGVHAVCTRWVCAQLDASRALCRAVTRAVAATPANNQQRGFTYM